MLTALLLSCTGAPPPTPPAAPEPLPAPWIASGDVTTDSAIIWAYAPQATAVTVTAGDQSVGPIAPGDASTVKLPLTGLTAGAEVTYTVQACAADGRCGEATGSFRTAPTGPAPLTLIVGGDLGGQGHCRPIVGGYRIFDAMAAREPDLFIANGDLIYADGTCTDTSPAGVATLPGRFPSVADAAVDWTDARPVFDAHWRYNHEDPSFRSFLQATPMISQWDDHEVVNDFGAGWSAWHTGTPERAGYPDVVAAGRSAFFDWSPIAGSTIARRFAWGSLVDIFVVDARSHRSNNALPDGPDKTLLGDVQAQALIADLIASTATWKIVTIDVPVSTPTGSSAWRAGRDGWANGTGASPPEGEADISTQTGFETELTEILTALDAAQVTGLVFVTTDVHHVRSIRYETDLNSDGTPLVFHEFISGPLSAWTGDLPALDPTFQPTVLFESSHTFNASLITVTPGEGLTAAILLQDGTIAEGSTVRLAE